MVNLDLVIKLMRNLGTGSLVEKNLIHYNKNNGTWMRVTNNLNVIKKKGRKINETKI